MHHFLLLSHLKTSNKLLVKCHKIHKMIHFHRFTGEVVGCQLRKMFETKKDTQINSAYLWDGWNISGNFFKIQMLVISIKRKKREKCAMVHSYIELCIVDGMMCVKLVYCILKMWVDIQYVYTISCIFSLVFQIVQHFFSPKKYKIALQITKKSNWMIMDVVFYKGSLSETTDKFTIQARSSFFWLNFHREANIQINLGMSLCEAESQKEIVTDSHWTAGWIWILTRQRLDRRDYALPPDLLAAALIHSIVRSTQCQTYSTVCLCGALLPLSIRPYLRSTSIQSDVH